MADITKAFYDKLSGDTTLKGLLAQYPAGSGTAAVFTADPVPGDAALPFVVTAGNIAQVPADTAGFTGREITRDIRCYAVATGSASAIEAIAERVRALFHRQPVTIAGFTWIFASALGPIPADETDVYGRIVSVRVRLDEP